MLGGKVMKRVIITILLLLVFLVKPTYASAQKVCVDAGHGGSDTGATYNGLEEKSVTLDIAKKLQTLLQNAGYTIVMTRTTDISLTNSQRAQICNQANADVLVSIHLNSSTNHSTDYTKGFYGKKLKDQSFTGVVHKALASELGIIDGGVTNFADGVLIKSNMPATLQETVFLTSDYEYGLLTDSTGNRQQQIAQALDDGIVNWFGLK